MDRNINLSQLGPDDASSYRELQLLALRLHPEAFGASLEEESAFSEGEFAERLISGTVFGAWSGNQLVGCAGLAQREKTKLRHKAIVWGMFVRRELTVVEGNKAAPLYAGAGSKNMDESRERSSLGTATIMSSCCGCRSIEAALERRDDGTS